MLRLLAAFRLFFVVLIAGVLPFPVLASEEPGAFCTEGLSVNPSIVRHLLENEWRGGRLLRSFASPSGVLVVDISDLGPGFVKVKVEVSSVECGTLFADEFVTAEPEEPEGNEQPIDDVDEWEEDDMSDP